MYTTHKVNMPFRCLHSGKCCEKEYTQINLTIGDLKRIADFLKLSVKDLFWHYAGMQPFRRDDNANVYDYELGLEIPCRFRQHSRCMIYSARPLNCRLFPYWIIANFPKEKWHEMADESYKCIHRTELDEETRKKYREYADKIGKLLLKEAKATDRIMKKLKMAESIDISWFRSAEALGNIHATLSGVELRKRIDEEKIRLCKKLLDRKKYKELPAMIGKEAGRESAVGELNELERGLDFGK
jgi:Fe-S-cluster containining protein